MGMRSLRGLPAPVSVLNGSKAPKQLNNNSLLRSTNEVKPSANQRSTEKTAALKVVGTVFWMAVYIVVVLQGLLSTPRPFMPWPSECLAYNISWELFYSIYPSVANKDRTTQGLMIAWLLADVPLFLLELYAADAYPIRTSWTSRTFFLKHLCFWITLYSIVLWSKSRKAVKFFKYFSLPYDIYISWALFVVMSYRPIIQSWDLASSSLKLVGDVLYLLPILQDGYSPTVKTLIAAVWLSDVLLVTWVSHKLLYAIPVVN